MKIFLASQSPRRKMLLQEAGYDVEVISSTYEEDNIMKDSPEHLVMEQARGKANGVDMGYVKQGIVLAADTIVVLGQKVLGKPHSEKEAMRMLQALSGKEHRVITGVALRSRQKEEVFCTSTYISFHTLTEEAIKNYVTMYHPLDKAGAYGLQELDEAWVKEVKGLRSNVIGLPVEEVRHKLLCFGE